MAYRAQLVKISVSDKILFVLASLSLFSSIGSATTPRKEVQSIPGFGKPPTKHWSGFIEVDPTSGSNLFYYLVESASDPTNDPLLWWMNGGPGASSFAGLFGEMGPLLLNDAADKLMPNPYAWNLHANVLFVEFAPGIGYSYCKNSSRTDLPCKQSSDDCSPCYASDTSVAHQNVAFLDLFLGPTLFPEFRSRPLFLVGESYAGVYIPTTAKALLDHHKDTTVVNLCGMWVTDPCTDNQAQYGWLDLGVQFALEKGLISEHTHGLLTSHKCSTGRTTIGDWVRSTKSVECRRAWRLYDIALAAQGNANQPDQVPGLPLYIDPLNAYAASIGPDFEAYLGRSDVQVALNANSTLNKVYHMEVGNNGYPQYTIEYAACNEDPHTQISMVDFYRSIINASRSGHPSAVNLRNIIISSGNIDPDVSLHGTEAAVEKIGYTIEKGGDRRPWFFNSTATDIGTLSNKAITWGQMLHTHNAGAQIGGFTIGYDTKSKVSLDFVTVRGSGHMVPKDAPQRGLHVIKKILLEDQKLSPLFPNGWGTSTDAQFYAYGTKTGGIFTQWVNMAMSDKYTN